MMGEKLKHFKKVFDFNGRNPDVLNSIANLSNDEVFTPPEFANQMLDTLEKAWADSNDGEIIWKNSGIRFLDPFTKSGVFLREIASRLIDGLEEEFPVLQDRVDHILTKQVFGIATTSLTALMARRTLYCSKQANGKYSITNKFNDESGNIWFEPLEHSWVGGKIKEISMDEDGTEIEIARDGRCEYCGASKQEFNRSQGLELHAYGLIHNNNPHDWIEKVFGDKMQFDVILGNPPYQISDGGVQGSASPIYHKFVTQAQALEPRFLSMVIPARWFVGGKGLDAFRKHMLSDKRLRNLSDYPDSREAFSGVDVAGGICYFLWDRENPGPTKVETLVNGESRTEIRELGEFDSFIRDGRAADIVRKVISKGITPFSSLVHPQKPFGLRSFYKPSEVGDVRLFASPKDGYIAPDEIIKNFELVSMWKVMVSKTASEHAGQTSRDGSKKVLSRVGVMPPGSACTESYLVIGPMTNESQALNLEGYMKTKFFRFLLSLRLITQNMSQESFNFVPVMNFSKDWSDSELFEYFGLTMNQIEIINKSIRPWGSS